MKIVDFVRPELIVAELTTHDKNEVIKELANHLAGHVPGVDRDALAKVLLERERLASTAIGEGVGFATNKIVHGHELLRTSL